MFAADVCVFTLQSLLQLIFKIKLAGAITPDSCKQETIKGCNKATANSKLVLLSC